MSVNEQYLRSIYYDVDSSVSYSGINKLWVKIKEDKKDITYSELKEWLIEQDVYTQHKPQIKKFVGLRVRVSGIDKQWQADLVDLQSLARYNKGYKYLLTVIDILSKYVWVKPLKTKRGQEVTLAFKHIFKERKPEIIQFDEGKEFYNKDLKSLFVKEDIEWFSSKSDKKASVVERFNRTLKTRMFKYFTHNETRKYTDILDELVDSYNNTIHSSTKMTPTEASKRENENEVWYTLYGADITANYGVPKFKVGHTVRISKYKSIFKKGYLPNFTEEIFKIKQVIYKHPIVYKLEDLQGEDLEGIFYEEELSEFNKPDEVYKIERILKYKIVRGNKYALIKWKGYPSKFNSWELASKIK